MMLLMIPCKKEELKRTEKKGYQIILISARPQWCKDLTEIWLKYHCLPFSKIYCVGFGKGTKQRKLEVIQKEGIEIFIDNDRKVRKFLHQNSIKVIEEFQQLNGCKNSHFFIRFFRLE